MSAFFGTELDRDEGLSLTPKRQKPHGSNCTRRVAELEATVARLRVQLQAAEDELQREMARVPKIGDFVRCPLTNFFGQVTKVTPRPHGRPWIEILPYLGRDIPGHATMDLFDSWELIDPPDADAEVQAPIETSPRLPMISAFAPLSKSLPVEHPTEEIEVLLKKLWTPPGKITS